MTEAMRRYRGLQGSLWLLRWSNEGRESAEEDAVLDAMDAAWADLAEEERLRLDEEGPRCWPMGEAGAAPALEDLARVLRPEQPRYDGFVSLDDAIQAAGGR